jgi:hypothetical protein
MPTVRKHERQLTLKTARITSDFIPDILPCAILDLSAGGACLLVADATPLPNEFDLTIDHTGDKWRCKIAWKIRHRVGVSFVSDYIPAPT